MSDKLKFIVKNKPLPVAQDMALLKEKGISLSKEFSGDIWTDYNEHDPGVTVLENLCYAIMEMSFKANFDFEQLFFANGDSTHQVQLEDYFLLKKEEVFYTNPVTTLDYRNFFLDKLGGDLIRNIWVDKHPKYSGSYVIYIYPENNKDQEAIKKEVKDHCNSHRNFGEQCKETIIIKSKQIENLIEINTDQEQQLSDELIVESLAQFIHDIKTYIEPSIRYAKSIKHLELKDQFLRQVQQGPKPCNKVVHPEDLELTSLEKLEEVIDIDAFIKRNASKWNNLITTKEDCKDKLKIAQFNRAKKEIIVFNEEDFLKDFSDELRQKVRETYQTKSIKPLLNGKVAWENYKPNSNLSRKDIVDYYSVQYTFPQNYNLGLADISMLSPSQQHQIKNLQSYLLLFESLLVDFLAKLISFPELLKLDAKFEKTAIEQQFLNILEKIPGIKLEKKEAIKKLYKDYSFSLSQQIQLRQYALARYGETFDINLLKKVWGLDSEEFEEVWLNRLNQLMNYYVAYSQGRHNSFDMSKPNSDFPLSRKLSFLLNQDYNEQAPNIYVIESSLVLEEENPFKVSIVIDLPLEDKKDQELQKRQKAIIELVKEELPFHLTYNSFWFLRAKKEDTRNITAIKDVLEVKEGKTINYLNKTQFKKVYREWRKSLAEEENN